MRNLTKFIAHISQIFQPITVYNVKKKLGPKSFYAVYCLRVSHKLREKIFFSSCMGILVALPINNQYFKSIKSSSIGAKTVNE